MRKVESDHYSYIENGLQSCNPPTKASTYQNETHILNTNDTRQFKSDVYENGPLSQKESIYENSHVTRTLTTKQQECVNEWANSTKVNETGKTLVYEDKLKPSVEEMGQNNDYFQLESNDECFELDKRKEYFDLEKRNEYFDLEERISYFDVAETPVHSGSAMNQEFEDSESSTYDQLRSSIDSKISDTEDDHYNHLQYFSTDYDLFDASKPELVKLQSEIFVEELPL